MRTLIQPRTAADIYNLGHIIREEEDTMFGGIIKEISGSDGNKALLKELDFLDNDLQFNTSVK